tara:strand:+ start:2507 stop:3298 length:792 start_codon:yes stop_codon:yes gene_type:complete
VTKAYCKNVRQEKPAYFDITIKKNLAIVELNRPPVNAISPYFLNQLLSSFTALNKDISVRAILIRSSLPTVFSAGADIRELSHLSAKEIRQFVEAGQNFCDLIETINQPTIAVIQGHALGGGCEIALSCDLRVAGKKASFGQPEVHLGLLPAWGGTQRLPQLIGKSRAMDLLLTGKSVAADTAFDIGLVNYLLDDDKVNSFAEDLAVTIGKQSIIATSGIKAAVKATDSSRINKGFDEEINQFVSCALSPRHKEDVRMFLKEK